MDCLGPGDEPSLQIHNYAFEHHSNILLFFGLLCVCLWGVCVVLVVLFFYFIYIHVLLAQFYARPCILYVQNVLIYFLIRSNGK